jgi:serine/threonine protein kinase
MISTELTEDYLLKEELGEGSFSKVYRAVNLEDLNEFAVKTIPKEKVENDLVLSMIVNEIDTMRRVRHPNIVNMHALYEDNDNLHLVLDLIVGETLFDLI